MDSGHIKVGMVAGACLDICPLGSGLGVTMV